MVKTKTTKKPKKKSAANINWLTKNINLRSRKTQLLFTILIFALIGGAWFTYKSFANTSVWNSSQILCTPNSGSECTRLPDAQKNGSQVTRLSYVKIGRPGMATVTTSVINADGSLRGSYRLCMAIKTRGGVLDTRVRNMNTNTIIFNSKLSLRETSGYERFCTAPFDRVGQGNRLQITFTHGTGALNSNPIFIGLATLEKVVTKDSQSSTPEK